MKTKHVVVLLVVVLALGLGVGLFLRSPTPASPPLPAPRPAAAKATSPSAPAPAKSPRTARPRGIARLTPPELAGLQHAIPLMSGLDPARELTDARSFALLDAEPQQRLAAAIARLRATTDADRQIDLLDEVEAQEYGAAILPVLLELLRADHPPELRMKVVKVVAGNQSAEILLVLNAALADPDPLVQAMAVLAANHLPGPTLVEFLGRVFAHPNANTRLAGLECLDEQPIETRVTALKLALDSQRPELQLGAIEKLTSLSRHQSVEALIPMLDAPDERIRGQASAALRFLIGEEFADTKTAQAWWQQNRGRFDKELTER